MTYRLEEQVAVKYLTKTQTHTYIYAKLKGTLITREEEWTRLLTSAMMQPADHTSEGKDQPISKITSGPRYCRVLTTVDFRGSLSYVAPPKSITARLIQRHSK